MDIDTLAQGQNDLIKNSKPGTQILCSPQRDILRISYLSDWYKTAYDLGNSAVLSEGTMSRQELKSHIVKLKDHAKLSLTLVDKYNKPLGMLVAISFAEARDTYGVQAAIILTNRGEKRFKDIYKIYPTIAKCVMPCFPIWLASKKKEHKTEIKLLKQIGFVELGDKYYEDKTSTLLAYL